MNSEEISQEMLLIICESSVKDDVLKHLLDMGIRHYSFHDDILGIGDTGRHEGNQVWPGTNTLILCCIPSIQVSDAVKSLKQIHDSRDKHSLGLKIFSMPARELL